MSADFFSKPILTPYAYPMRHWELDEHGQLTYKIIEKRRPAEFITPIPKPKKRKSLERQESIVFNEGKGLSTQEQQYDITAIINAVRDQVDAWRKLPNPSDWQVTPETARLLQHCRHHEFNNTRPFFCQVEAVETAIWLTEVAANSKAGKGLLDHLANANNDANPGLNRLALKLAMGGQARRQSWPCSLHGKRSMLSATRTARNLPVDFSWSRRGSRSKTVFASFSQTTRSAHV